MKLVRWALLLALLHGAVQPAWALQYDADPRTLKDRRISKDPRVSKDPRWRPTKGTRRVRQSHGALTIQTTPARCSVSLARVDAKRMPANTIWLTDDNGFLDLPPLLVGRYTVTVSKEGYEARGRSIELIRAKELHEHFELEPRPVELLVTAGVRSANASDREGVQIEIGGVGTYTDRAKVRVKPGKELQITARKAGYKPSPRTVVPEIGRDLTVSIELRPLEVNEVMPNAEAAYGQGQYEEAAALCRELLLVRPESPRAHLMLGLCNFRLGKTVESAEHLAVVTQKGRGILVPIQHLHPEARGRDADRCSGYILLAQSGLWFVSTMRAGHDFRKQLSSRDLRGGLGGFGVGRLVVTLDASERVEVGVEGISGTDVTTGSDLTVVKAATGAAPRKEKSRTKPAPRQEYVFEPAPLASAPANCPKCSSTAEIVLEVAKRIGQ
jgi:hypothetical protein